jgi:hypothetical protein
MMKKLARSDLWSLEQYAERRQQFRAEVMAHKKNRQLALNDNARLYFEDEMTIRYQVQEMLRIEKVFEADGIEEELEAYNPLIPDGSNWKATFMLEYGDVDERQQMVKQLVGIETKVWMQAQGCDKVYPIADEDLERSDGERTSTVHFLRFELDSATVAALQGGAALLAGIDHPHMVVAQMQIPDAVRDSLVADLAPAATH